MPSPLARLLVVLALALSPLSAPADTTEPISRSEAPQSPSSIEISPEVPPTEPDVEELPRMTNKTLAFGGVAFMLTVCVAFSVFGGYSIYIRDGHSKKVD